MSILQIINRIIQILNHERATGQMGLARTGMCHTGSSPNGNKPTGSSPNEHELNEILDIRNLLSKRHNKLKYMIQRKILFQGTRRRKARVPC